MVRNELKVEISREDVFRQIDCPEESELYQEILEEYQEIEEEVYSLCEPVFLMEYTIVGPELAKEGIPEGAHVLMVLYSIGGKISDYSTRCFAEGNYMKGLLADAMADSALFSLEKEIVPYLKEECGRLQMGIGRRLEAPQDISMEVQKVIFERTGAREKYGMRITSGYMLEPVKSNAVLYVLTGNREVFAYQHDCRNCDRYDCKVRNVAHMPVKVSAEEKVYSLMVKEGESILDALTARDATFSAICGGTGRCGKCKIRVVDGCLPVTASDREHFTEAELTAGMRLACRAYPSEPVQVELRFTEGADFQVLAEYGQGQTGHYTLGIAVDIGTTTIAIQLLSLNSGERLASYTTVNGQRSFGADVISRIQASVDGKKEKLRRMIQQDLAEGIRCVVAKAKVLPQHIAEVVIAGNTTMGHLLMGYDCKGLGKYPFKPVHIQQITDSYANIIGDNFLTATVHILPGISAFVGGDVVAGLYACDVDKREEYSLLIDLGTNGEIVLGNRDKIIATSTAAGPAFEGGSISFGVGSIEGAIAGVTIEKADGHRVHIRTIGNKEPVGICGTGVLETIAELLKTGLLDDTGCLVEEYFDTGYPLAKTGKGIEIVLTQQDIREIQLAKAAVRAGIETIFLRFGIPKEAVAHVYLAGGFGFQLDCQKAIEIGMLPGEFAGKMEAVGNSSLGGAVKFLLAKNERERVQRIGMYAEEINLSAQKDFGQFYMECMYFDHI